MDTLDFKILRELNQNSREAISSVSKRLKVSREVLNYRINRLLKSGTIIEFITKINADKLGFVAAAVFVKLKTKREEDFKNLLNSCGFVSWVAELSGLWSFGFSIYGKDNSDLNDKFSKIYGEFKDEILDYKFILHDKTEFFYEKYFQSLSKMKENKRISYKPDRKDKIILSLLAKNSRLDVINISKKVNLTAPAVATRIRKLKESDIIEGFSLFVDISKLGLMQYSIFIVNKNFNEKAKFLTFLKNHKKISFVAEYIGESLIEFGVVINNPYMLREILREIEESFPENRIQEISMFQKEYISVGLPSCVFT